MKRKCSTIKMSKKSGMNRCRVKFSPSDIHDGGVQRSTVCDNVPFKPDAQNNIVAAGVRLKESEHNIEIKLARQKILEHVTDKELRTIVKKGIPLKYQKGDILALQGDPGKHVFLILHGSVDVFVNGRKVATRTGRECVGEMSVLDPAATRSATLKAGCECWVVRLEERFLTELIQKNHKVLLAIALELSERLRERSKYLVKPNITPRIFIGSSSEYLKVATKLEEALSKDRKLTVHLWKNGVFDLSQSNIESLVEEATHVDFAVFLLSKDDIVRSKGKKQKGPRDNVLFEYGLFMGMIGRDRTYALSCGGNVKIPSDLDGITRIEVPCKKGQRINLHVATEKIQAKITEKGVR